MGAVRLGGQAVRSHHGRARMRALRSGQAVQLLRPLQAVSRRISLRLEVRSGSQGGHNSPQDPAIAASLESCDCCRLDHDWRPKGDPICPFCAYTAYQAEVQVSTQRWGGWYWLQSTLRADCVEFHEESASNTDTQGLDADESPRSRRPSPGDAQQYDQVNRILGTFILPVP